MAESEKTDSAVKPKEKKSLLVADLDIGKDLFGSWKDDGMDFDFGPTTKGNKKDFKFDKMDMDFGADFDKLPSFKMDMSGLDISSPIKKSGKAKEKSKEDSSGGANRAKRDSFGFSFDFDEFSDFGFDSKKTKVDDKSNKSKDKEGNSNESNSGGSGDFLAKDIVASKEDDVSSKIDTQKDNIEDPVSRNDNYKVKAVIDESTFMKHANSEEQELQRTIEPIQESASSEERYSPEPPGQKAVQDSYARSQDSTFSTEGTFSDMQEEESRTLVIMASPSKMDEQNDNISAQMKAQSEKGEMCVTRDDNVVTESVEVNDTSKADLHLESHVSPGIENLAHEDIADTRNSDSLSEHHGELLGSGTTTDELASDKERGKAPLRSKYFKKQNGSLESETQQASASSTKLISTGNKKTTILPSNPASDKREFAARSLESGSKFTGLSRSLPKLPSRDIPVQTENKETSHVKSLDNTRKGLNAGNNIRPRNELVVTTVAHDVSSMKEKPVSKGSQQNAEQNADNRRPINDSMVTTVAHDISPMKEKPVTKGSDQNTEHINAHRSDVHPSSSIQQLRKSISLNSGTSTHETKKPVVKENRIFPTNVELKASEVSTPKVSRPTESKLKPLNSLLPKHLISMRNKDQSPELQRNTVFKRNLSVDTKKQTPPTPTRKRKTFEESEPGDTARLTSFKRLSASPCSNNTRASLEKVVGEQGCNRMSVAQNKSPRLNVSLTEMDTYSSIENDGIFEKAEACSKELDDICNMLKKKQEEANDLLVRAVVNNNNLLMLNHPIHQEKIRMVQKFAELLLCK